MDDVEDCKLKETAKIKQIGNDLYKSGEFKDARKCYHQVLELLASETSLTRGEKEKRDKLVLTSHLNLAACELKLADNARVVEHCSLVLQMDKDCLKAYYRRGQAYHNNTDFDLALKDYLEAERLEPQNAEVKNQKERLLADKLEAHERVAGQEPLADAQDEDCHEMVVVYENNEEAELRDYDRQCPKAIRHNEYIPVSQFCLEHLPPRYRTDTVFTSVEALISLTVLLRVLCSSSKRPAFVPGTTRRYPFSGSRYRNQGRYGSGQICFVMKYPKEGNELCPCDTCKNSETPRKQFAKIELMTAAHVIFDISEGRKSICYFNYDSDQTARSSCPKLSAAVKVVSDVEGDISYVVFVTHDLQFAEKLDRASRIYRRLCEKIKWDFGIVQEGGREDMELSVRFSNLHEKYQEIMQKLRQYIDDLEEIKNGDVKQMFEDYIRKYDIKAGEELNLPYYGKLLYDTLRGANPCEKQLRDNYTLYEICVRQRHHSQQIKDNFDACVDHNGYQYLLDQYKEYRSCLMLANRSLQMCTAKPGDVKANDKNDDSDERFYNPCHPFTIIVSHPHALGKKISLGEVTERNVSTTSDKASYIYTNTTCPGSSGAPVFIMGRLGTVSGTRPHSKMVHIQKNRSTDYVDW